MTDTTNPSMAGTDELPDAGLFWRWAGQATRPVAGWVLLALGAVLILAGYLGVSREALVAKQLPYLVSGGVAGLALVAVGAFLLGTEDLRGRLQRLEEMEAKIDDLHEALLTVAEERESERESAASAAPRAARAARARRATADA